MKIDLLIINALLSNTTLDRDIPGPAYLAIKDGLIAGIGPMPDLPATTIPAKTIDAGNRLAMPGLVNAHNHSAMTLFRGLADDLPLQTWLNDHMFPAEARFVNPEMVYWCSKLAAAEMILSGTTTVADGYFYEDQAARAFKEAGLRAVAAQGVIDFPAPGVPDPANNIEVATAFLGSWQQDPLITPAVFCHSPYTCSSQTLKSAKALTLETGRLLFVHLAETAGEVRNSHEQLGLSPVQYLAELGILDEKTVCVHCVWLTAEDITVMKECGAAIVSCPESNMKLAAGIAPLAAYLAAGIPLALGTDGCASNNDLDMFCEMDMAAKLHKVTSGDPTLLPAREMVRLATRAGGRILGLAPDSGVLSPGAPADIILLDLRKPRLTPCYDPDSLITFAAHGEDVTTSIINGRLVMEERSLVNFDVEECLDRISALAEEVRKTI